MSKVEEEECAKARKRTQHAVWRGTEMTTGDAGWVSRGQDRKTVSHHTEEAGQRWRAPGVYQAGEHWGNDSGCTGNKLGRVRAGHRNPGKCQLWPEHMQRQWEEDEDRSESW